MKTANLAIVFTDIQGFTERTSRQTLEQNQRLLAAHSELMRPLFQAFGGRVVKSIGDAFLVTFDSPTQAVLCGAAIQDRLWQYNRTAPDPERLDVRVAINVGEVRLESSDVFGEPVNIAARVEQLAVAGEVYFTEAVYLAMNKAEVPSEEVGAYELKGIPGKIRVFRIPRAPYRVQAAGARADQAAEAPPFGNLGLSRVQDDLRTEKFVARAAELGGKLVNETQLALARVPPGRRALLLRAGAASLALLVAIALVVGLRRTPLERALDALAGAAGEERAARLVEARRLLAEERDPGRAAYYQGRLDEALGGPARATHAYAEAVERGEPRGARRLIELLEHPECRVREAAASRLGELRLRRAEDALEELSQQGGPGEDDRPLIGCDSRGAAAAALRAIR